MKKTFLMFLTVIMVVCATLFTLTACEKECAHNESDWFVKTVKSILADLHDRTCSHPQELEFDEWRGILSEMVRLLELMDSYDDMPIRKELGIDENDMSTESNKKIVSARNEAKNEFFTLFNKWFYHLWF